MEIRRPLPKNQSFLAASLAGLIVLVLLISGITRSTDNPISCQSRSDYPTTPIQLRAILYYATSTGVPQQSKEEIKVTFDVLQSLSASKYLVFGLGNDSVMWASLNTRGTTLFLEEDPEWVQSILKEAPDIRAHTIKYPTKLSQADDLLSSYKSEPECLPPKSYLRGNVKCPLALANLPEEVYETEWDMIMIDAPKGWYADAPGRMGAIYSAAVMARNRKGSGVTHVFLHDIDRRVEKIYAEEFLCKKYFVKGVGRLWHFAIPPAANGSDGSRNSSFC
ncbi:Methyltransferase [Actinidia chinensis var. chinensis]|uniref:Methyltransferase n=1 Tax=Actinidia chinensis var. chinensis TaxID=1590841 RepID=A0A2R6P397_ACTCC|nr:Methyltransferase [Actinidia chinensis var. chinensis]